MTPPPYFPLLPPLYLETAFIGVTVVTAVVAYLCYCCCWVLVVSGYFAFTCLAHLSRGIQDGHNDDADGGWVSRHCMISAQRHFRRHRTNHCIATDVQLFADDTLHLLASLMLRFLPSDIVQHEPSTPKSLIPMRCFVVVSPVCSIPPEVGRQSSTDRYHHGVQVAV